MLKMRISKVRKIFSVVFIPRILREEFTLTPWKAGKRPLDGLWKFYKSTDSKDQEVKCEKCKKVIEMIFGNEKKDHVIKNTETPVEDVHLDKISGVAPQNEIAGDFVSGNNAKQLSIVDQKQSHDVVQTTTAKEVKEELAQKLETIEEPLLVEAGTPKTEGFNGHPKVLGERDITEHSRYSFYTKIGPEEDAMDAIAKKCLSSPPDKIDERIIEELKSCGMLGKGRRKPSSRRYRSHVDRPYKKEQESDTKVEEIMLYFKKQHTPIGSEKPYPSVPHLNLTPPNLESIHATYFKNVHAPSIKSTEQQSNVGTRADPERVHIKQVSAADSAVVSDSVKGLEVSTEKTNSSQTVTHTENKPEEATEVEEIRIADNEVKTDDIKAIKPDILPCNQIVRATEMPAIHLSFEPDKREHVVFSTPTNPYDWRYQQDTPEFPFNQPNTAISGTYPQTHTGQQQQQLEVEDTAISAKQNPSEFYDFANGDAETLRDYAITPSTVRPLEAYHPYTIITGTEDVHQLHNAQCSTGESASEIRVPRVDNESAPNTQTIDANISAAMGPVPQLKETEEEVPLTEMLRRVRDRNRLQYCQECHDLRGEHVVAHKCWPPLNKGPAKTLGPGPCKPKAKPAAPPPPKCPPPCRQPCPPPCKKKDPCAKFTKTTLLGDRIKETFTLVLQVGLTATTNPQALSRKYINSITEPLKRVRFAGDTRATDRLSALLLSRCSAKKVAEEEDVTLTRDYAPWSPIPSWPVPKVEKRKTFVCPKEGCKIVPPPRLNPPCKENPCVGLPKRSFAALGYFCDPLYLYEDND